MANLQQYFYDQQIRRFLIQVMRAFSNFQVSFGKDSTGADTFYTIPVKYGDASRQASIILKNNNENSIPNTPMISIYISGLKYARDRVTDPTYVDRINIRESAYDGNTNSYITQQQNAYSIDRLMPVPYDLTLKADIWTSSTDQKLQILEQFLILFNPSLEIQSTDNYIDWGSLTAIEQTDINWSSKSVPVGTEDPIDIATLEFKLPIWLSAPARVTKMGVIQKVITSIFDASGYATNLKDFVAEDNLLLGTRQGVTFQNYGIFVNSGTIKLLKATPVVTGGLGENDTPVGTTYSWPALLDKYGVIRNGTTEVRLQYSDDNTLEIVGVVAVHPTDERILLYTIDEQTLPVNTLDAITAIIDPQISAPGINGLPVSMSGQRYLLTKATGSNLDSSYAAGWYINGNETVANANDIIQFDGNKWNVVFNSIETKTIEYVTNLTTTKQYKWTGEKWQNSFEGEYRPLNWRIVI